VNVAVLAERWIDGVGLVNIGKAKHGQLRKRIRAYHSFGSGGSGRHSGGRYVWQLADAWDCLIAWRELPADVVPRDVEEAMIADFFGEYGKRPFANIVGSRQQLSRCPRFDSARYKRISSARRAARVAQANPSTRRCIRPAP
jgi:hypothetical protein